MPSSSGGALRRLAAETLVPDPFAAADVDDFGGRRTNETREALEVGLSASGPSSSNCFHERGIRAERRKLRTLSKGVESVEAAGTSAAADAATVGSVSPVDLRRPCSASYARWPNGR